MCALVVAGAYGIPWIVNRLTDDPIMRKHINEGSIAWDRVKRRGPDPSKFLVVTDDPEDEEERDKGILPRGKPPVS
jgi:hypothetical protein